MAGIRARPNRSGLSKTPVVAVLTEHWINPAKSFASVPPRYNCLPINVPGGIYGAQLYAA